MASTSTAPSDVGVSGETDPMADVLALPTLEDLQRHVRETLCVQDKLDPRATPLAQAKIVRSGKPCGLFFQVKGPRHLRTHAVWAGDESRILFYDSAGIRF